MRSSKSRSRNKSNRQRSIGNIINRVFDSSGPEGKVRGTPQQIIDKYLALARDAQLGNDRVAEQNFLQHAEHYTRMLGEAQREIAREQEDRQRNFQQNGGQNGGQNGNHNGGQSVQGGGRDRAERGDFEVDRDTDAPVSDAVSDVATDTRPASRNLPQTDFDVAAMMPEPIATADDSGLVDTPEARLDPMPEDEPEAGDEVLPGLDIDPAQDAAPARPRARTRRAPRKPRSPKGEDTPAETQSDAAGE